MKPTRYEGLGYYKQAESLWRFVMLETGAVIGGQYRTEKELLADMHRFAEARGFTE